MAEDRLDLITPACHDLSVGERLGPYEVVEPPRRGGMGSVYRAKDTRLGRSVAIKVIGGSREMTPAARDRFKREARAVAALDHPNICALYDVGSAPQGGPSGPVVDFLVMEYLHGQTLEHRLAPVGEARAAAPLMVEDALAFGLQIVDALATAHEAGFVHRDLKPSNVMLVAPGPGRGTAVQAKLLDFGLAKHVGFGSPAAEIETETGGTPTTPGTVLGTLGYLSPEQARGEEVDGRSDLFAFGAVFFEMLTGRPAFTRPSGAETIAAVLHDKPPRPSALNPAVPPACDVIVEKALEKNRERRYQAAADLRADLRRVEREREGTPSPSSGASRAWPEGRRRRAWASGSLAVLLVSLVVLWWGTRAPWGGRTGGETKAQASASPVVFEPPFQVTSAPGWEDQPAPSPDGSLIAYVSNESGNPDVWVVGTWGGNRVQITKDGAVEEAPSWYPDGTALVYASNRGGTWSLWKAPPLGGSAEVLVPNAREPAISPTGESVAFVRNDGVGCPRIHVAPLADLSRARLLVTPGTGPCYAESHPAWSPSGRAICFAGDRALWAVSAAGGAPSRVTAVHEYDREPVWVTDTSVVFSSYRNGIFALWQSEVSPTAVPRRLTSGAAAERNPGVSKDGRLLAFSSFAEDEDLVLRNIRTGREVLYSSTLNEISPTVCRNEADIIFARNRRSASGSELQRLPLRDWLPVGESVPLATGTGSAAGPRCSPDGKWVVYFRVWQGRRRLWVAPLGGGPPASLTDTPATNAASFDDTTPSWDPDGGRVAFASTRGGGWDIWVLDVTDGRPLGEPRRVTSGPGTKDWPRFSPDGKWIAFAVEGEAGREVAVVPADGAQSYRPVTRGADALFAEWVPGTSALAVSGTWGGTRLVVRRVGLDGTADLSLPPLADLGPPTAIPVFDFSRDGTHIVFSRGKWSGDVFAAGIRPLR